MKSKWEPPTTQNDSASSETPTVHCPAYGRWRSLALVRPTRTCGRDNGLPGREQRSREVPNDPPRRLSSRLRLLAAFVQRVSFK